MPSIIAGQLADLTLFRLEQNEIGGTMPESICDLLGEDNFNLLGSGSLSVLTSDCAGENPEIVCECCSNCF